MHSKKLSPHKTTKSSHTLRLSPAGQGAPASAAPALKDPGAPKQDAAQPGSDKPAAEPAR